MRDAKHCGRNANANGSQFMCCRTAVYLEWESAFKAFGGLSGKRELTMAGAGVKFKLHAKHTGNFS